MAHQLLAVLSAAALLLPAPRSADVATGGWDPSSTAQRPLRFVLGHPLQEGGKTRVRLENTGDVSYTYNPYYEACDMVFEEASGRNFLVPEGTHCDLVAHEEVEPGETVTLFRWDLDECVVDNWGCVKARDLPRGRYLMRGWFKPKGGGESVVVIERFSVRKP